MKNLAFILSVYVLALTAIPCVDVPKDDVLHKTELSNTASEHHEHTTDLCSPFCTCDCCVSPIVNNNSTVPFACSSHIQGLFAEYKNFFVSALYVAIWQPPKLVKYNFIFFISLV